MKTISPFLILRNILFLLFFLFLAVGNTYAQFGTESQVFNLSFTKERSIEPKKVKKYETFLPGENIMRCATIFNKALSFNLPGDAYVPADFALDPSATQPMISISLSWSEIYFKYQWKESLNSGVVEGKFKKMFSIFKCFQLMETNFLRKIFFC